MVEVASGAAGRTVPVTGTVGLAVLVGERGPAKGIEPGRIVRVKRTIPKENTRQQAVKTPPAIAQESRLECFALITLTYYLKLPPGGKLRELLSYDMAFARIVLRPVLPVAINEILCSLGITAYQVIYARTGTEQLAAMNISIAIVDLAVVAFIGLANATSILVDNFIGSRDETQAQVYAGRSLALSGIGGMVIGVLIFLLSPFILSLSKVSPETIAMRKKSL